MSRSRRPNAVVTSLMVCRHGLNHGTASERVRVDRIPMVGLGSPNGARPRPPRWHGHHAPGRRPVGRGRGRRAHRGAGASRHAAHGGRARRRRDGTHRRAGRRRATHAPRASDPDAPRRAQPDPRPGGRHPRDGVRRHHDPHRFLLRPAGDRDRRRARPAHGALGRPVPRRLQLPRDAVRGAAARGLRRDARGDRGRLPELQGVHDRRPSAASPAPVVPPRLRAHRDGHESGGPARGTDGGPRGGRRARADRLRALPRRGAAGRDEHAPRPHEALGAARVRADDRSRASDGRRRVLRPHLRPRGRRGGRGGAGGGRRGLCRDAPPVRLLRRGALQDAARVLRPHVPVAQAARGPRGALARARGRRRLDAGHGRVSHQPRAEAARAGRSRT